MIYKIFAYLVLAVSAAWADSPPEAQSLPPEQDALQDNTVDYDRINRIGDGDYWVTTNQTGLVIGFNFTNYGPNRVVPTPPGSDQISINRDYTFEFQDRARQNIALQVIDYPNATDSEKMISLLYFFPRNVIPSIQWGKESFTVQLPTEEWLRFNSKTKEVVEGPMIEKLPLDLSKNRFNRRFADLEYTGTGVILRVDRRGSEPRAKNIAVISKRLNGKSLTCKIATEKLFEQDPKGAFNFKFPTDDSFDLLLKSNCSFGMH